MPKPTMFKQLAHAQYENLGNTGGWNPLFTLEKQQDSMKSCYVDKIRISFIVEGDGLGGDLRAKDLGFLFIVTNKQVLSATDQDNTPFIISAGAQRAGGGVLTLDVGRRIAANEFDEERGDGMLSCQVRCTDIGTDTPDITLIAEVMGRWHKVVEV